jgi:hypothetical protein
MAHIELRGQPGGGQQIIINGIDFSREVFRGVELVEVGDSPEFAEVGLRITLAVSRLDLDAEADVKITDHLPEVAQRVRSMDEAAC